MTMAIKLDSDFRDYYDHWFSGSWQQPDFTFTRNSTGGMSRREMFEFMRSLGITTPAFGTVKELVSKMASFLPAQPDANLHSIYLDAAGDVVVYTDIRAHAGEGKVKMSLREAFHHHPNDLASEFIVSSSEAQTLRYLRVGRRQFWLQYTSNDDWRSNCGDVDIKVLGEEFSMTPFTLMGEGTSPVFAIDFVFATHMYAVDYNIAPQLAGTGIEEILPAKSAYDEIARWYEEQFSVPYIAHYN